MLAPFYLTIGRMLGIIYFSFSCKFSNSSLYSADEANFV